MLDSAAGNIDAPAVRPQLFASFLGSGRPCLFWRVSFLFLPCLVGVGLAWLGLDLLQRPRHGYSWLHACSPGRANVLQLWLPVDGGPTFPLCRATIRGESDGAAPEPPLRQRQAMLLVFPFPACRAGRYFGEDKGANACRKPSRWCHKHHR